MKRLGLTPGAGLVVQPGRRNASLLVSIDGKPAFRVSHQLASEILVLAGSPG
jgi:hypothetical protein